MADGLLFVVLFGHWFAIDIAIRSEFCSAICVEIFIADFVDLFGVLFYDMCCDSSRGPHGMQPGVRICTRLYDEIPCG